MEKNKITDRQEATIILKRYLRSKRTVDYLKEGYMDLGEVRTNIDFNFYAFIAKVEATLSCLDSNSLFIIENELLKIPTPYWWQEYYSRSSYYRLREKAYKQFVTIYKTE